MHTHTPQTALNRPILYSNWLSKDYLPVDQEELRDYVQARLKVFYEEELDVPLVLFNEVLDHVLRIDRIFKQNQVYTRALTSSRKRSHLSNFLHKHLYVVIPRVHNRTKRVLSVPMLCIE